MAGKPLIITRVVDSMVGNLRPTRAEATDITNAVLDGADGILLGGETFGGLYPVEAIKTVGKISSEFFYVRVTWAYGEDGTCYDGDVDVDGDANDADELDDDGKHSYVPFYCSLYFSVKYAIYN